jgi:hypothetical protein
MIDGVKKDRRSTFFPKDWTEKQVESAIEEAYKNRKPEQGTGVYRGQTIVSGIEVELQLDGKGQHGVCLSRLHRSQIPRTRTMKLHVESPDGNGIRSPSLTTSPTYSVRICCLMFHARCWRAAKISTLQAGPAEAGTPELNMGQQLRLPRCIPTGGW